MQRLKIKYFFIFAFFVHIVFILACNRQTTGNEIITSYDNKTDRYLLTYPEYNKIYPTPASIRLKRSKSFNMGIILTYNIKTDNVPLLLELSIIENDITHKYSMSYPVVGRDVKIEILASDFTPALKLNSKVQNVKVGLESKGDVDTKDVLVVSFAEIGVVTSGKKKTKERANNLPILLLPESGHVVMSNPPFFVWDKKIPVAKLLLSQHPLFNLSETYSYNVNRKSFFTPTNTLENGRWYAKFEDSSALSSDVFTFFVLDDTPKINPLENIDIKNNRPFIFTSKEALDRLKYSYQMPVLQNSILSRNLFAFKEYSANHIGTWSQSKIVYDENFMVDEGILFKNLISHTMIVSLYQYLEPKTAVGSNYIHSMIKDISEMDVSEISEFDALDSHAIISTSLVVAFDWLYHDFSQEEIIRIKNSLISHAEHLYQYLLESKSAHRLKSTINYASTLLLISLNLANENLQTEKVLEWYNFSLSYVNSNILSLFDTNGSFKSPISDSFELLMPLMLVASSLKNAGVYDMFEMEAFKNIAKFLTLAAYPSGYSFPIGNSSVDPKTYQRYDSGARSAVMELFSMVYQSQLYKNYASYGLGDVVEIPYLPFILIWHAFDVTDVPAKINIQDYQFAYFKNIESIIYNENILNQSNAYFALYAKGREVDASFGLKQDDRMTFVYYNYGDKIISEAEYIDSVDTNIISNISSQHAHSGASINDKPMLAHAGTFSYVVSSTNDERMLYAHAAAEKQYSYFEQIKEYSRRFYYIKPNVLIIKEHIEAIPNILNGAAATSIIRHGAKYSLRFTSKSKIVYNAASQEFIIDAKNSTTSIKILEKQPLNFFLSEIEINNTTHYIALVETSDNAKSLSPWVIIATTPKIQVVNLSLGQNTLESLNVLNFDSEHITFNSRGKRYSIFPKDRNIDSAVYIDEHGDITIRSD